MDKDRQKDDKSIAYWVMVVFAVVFVLSAAASIYDYYSQPVCEDGEYTLIMPDGAHGGCASLPVAWNRATSHTTDPQYINGTEITRLERIGVSANFTINNDTTLVYWEIVPHVIYDNEVQRYAVEYIDTTHCDQNVMIGDRNCVTKTSRKYHIFIHSNTLKDFKWVTGYMVLNDVTYASAGDEDWDNV